jgi:hypothetical protein
LSARPLANRRSRRSAALARSLAQHTDSQLNLREDRRVTHKAGADQTQRVAFPVRVFCSVHVGHS